jgi:hypothetical protein
MHLEASKRVLIGSDLFQGLKESYLAHKVGTSNVSIREFYLFHEPVEMVS